MDINYKIDKTESFSATERVLFLALLMRQGKVSNPTLEKIGSCPYLCMASIGNRMIGIGALKQVYKTPFDDAGVSDLKSNFSLELGYLYVLENHYIVNLRGMGIGKNITRLLLAQEIRKNIFATTELNVTNPMLHILRKFGFIDIGSPYIGHSTHDIITLMILIRE